MPGISEAGGLGLSMRERGFQERDVARWSLGRALVGRFYEGGESGLEGEVQAELRRAAEAGGHLYRGGILVPWDVLAPQTRRLDSASGAIFTDPRATILQLSRVSILARLGALVLPGLVGNVRIPRVQVAPEIEWIGEIPEEDFGDTEPTLGDVFLKPRWATGNIASTRQLLVQSATVASAEAMLRDSLFRAWGSELDRVGIAGDGELEPDGILFREDVHLVAAGNPDGAALTWDHLLEMEEAVGEADGEQDLDALGFATTSGVRRQLRNTERITGSGREIWTGNQVLDAPAVASTAVPSNLTKGAGEDLHAALWADWSSVIVGLWHLEVFLDPISQKRRGRVEVQFFGGADVGLRHPDSVAVVRDVEVAA